MTVSIGIDYKLKNWKTCLIENGQGHAFLTFEDAHAVISYLKHIYTTHPELVIALSLPREAALMSLESAVWESQTTKDEFVEVHDFLREVRELSLKGYLLPAIKYLPTIPRYRRLKYASLGSADTLCTVATLLYRMRQQDASWPEMRFFYLEVNPIGYSITVIKDGHIMDGIDAAFIEDENMADEEERTQAFRERLVQDLAGLMTIHQLEDIVIGDRDAASRKHAVIESLGESYQFYLFPHSESQPGGFEAAQGAAILTEGLATIPGLAMEVTERLFSLMA